LRLAGSCCVNGAAASALGTGGCNAKPMTSAARSMTAYPDMNAAAV